MERAKGRITRSSGNVFTDLGFGREEAEHLVIRSELMIKIEKLLKARGLTQSEAARIMRVSQPRVSRAVSISVRQPSSAFSERAPRC